MQASPQALLLPGVHFMQQACGGGGGAGGTVACRTTTGVQVGSGRAVHVGNGFVGAMVQVGSGLVGTGTWVDGSVAARMGAGVQVLELVAVAGSGCDVAASVWDGMAVYTGGSVGRVSSIERDSVRDVGVALGGVLPLLVTVETKTQRQKATRASPAHEMNERGFFFMG